MAHPFAHIVRPFPLADGTSGSLFSLPDYATSTSIAIDRLPRCLRIILESLLRTCDDRRITRDQVEQVARWSATAPRDAEVPFTVARIVLQDFTGVPLLCDLAMMRSVTSALGRDPGLIEPRVPVDLVIDHSVQIDAYNSANALDANMDQEFARNHERYRFIKWGMQAFTSFKVIAPGIGIVHQVNLEYLAPGVMQQAGVYFPDSLVGTDSHTTMINGLGVVGWGVGGIEAEAAMMGQPIYLLLPDIIGVELSGALRPGVTATDLVLSLTQMLRAAKVVGKFVEFFGAGSASLTVPDRATIANMAPEYGATMGYFPIDDKTVDYLRFTGRSEKQLAAFTAYYQAQQLYGMPMSGAIDYTRILSMDLGTVAPSVAGPRRPQDRIALHDLKDRIGELLIQPTSDRGYGKQANQVAERFAIDTSTIPHASATAPPPLQRSPDAPAPARHVVEMAEAASAQVAPAQLAPAAHTSAPAAGTDVGHHDVLIAAITSCTNTSNPSVMLCAGLLAKKAVERGLRVRPLVKTSLAPGSRVVTDYLSRTGLLPYLEKLGFWITAYGCTTCIGNSGPLDPAVEKAVIDHDLICAAVLSGNRNFEARIHPSIRANFLMSPPLVVAYAITGSVHIDLENEPLGVGGDGRPVFLRDIWPSPAEIQQLLPLAQDPAVYQARYRDLDTGNPRWQDIATAPDQVYAWKTSSYIARPPFLDDFALSLPTRTPIRQARALAIFGNSITTDHISPAGSIDPASPAGHYLRSLGIAREDFNSYGSRRGNHQVMVRGTFANVRIVNLMMASLTGTPAQGGVTVFQPHGEAMSIFDAAQRYQSAGVPTLVFAGEEYGTGSSRDWAAKGTLLLGVKAVVARSFERIHRSNLVGMGLLPLQFMGSDSVQSLNLRGDELFALTGLENGIVPGQQVRLVIERADGSTGECMLLLRIDSPIEVDYVVHGGILPYALRQLLNQPPVATPR